MFKIALDAGHGLHTGGKRCLRSLDPNETREWWLNNRICDEIERILATECKLGEDYDLIRLDDTTGETDVSLDSRVAKANNFKADYLLSIHHNAGAKGTSVGGPTVHIRPNRGEDSWQKMGVLWDNFIGQVNKLGFSNRMSSNVWVNRFKVISGIKDACLFECGFMDSRVDINYILREDYAMAAARGFANGLMQIGGLVPSNPQSSTENSEVNQQPSDEKEEENTSDNNNNHIYDNYWDFMSSLSSNSSSSKDNPSNEKQETPEKDEEHRFSTSTGGDYITKPLSPYNNLLYHPQRKEIESLYKIGILTIKDETSDSNKNYFKTDGEWISRGDFALLLYLTRCYFMGTNKKDAINPIAERWYYQRLCSNSHFYYNRFLESIEINSNKRK